MFGNKKISSQQSQKDDAIVDVDVKELTQCLAQSVDKWANIAKCYEEVIKCQTEINKRNSSQQRLQALNNQWGHAMKRMFDGVNDFMPTMKQLEEYQNKLEKLQSFFEPLLSGIGSLMSDVFDSQENSDKTLQAISNKVDKVASGISASTDYLKRLSEMEGRFGELHSELQTYKDNKFDELYTRPFIIEMCNLYNQYYRYVNDVSDETLSSNFASMFEDIIEFLSKYGVEMRVSTKESDMTGLKSSYEIIEKRDTEHKTLDGLVAESICAAFIQDGKVLTKERVAVYKYKNPIDDDKQKENNNSNEENKKG